MAWWVQACRGRWPWCGASELIRFDSYFLVCFSCVNDVYRLRHRSSYERWPSLIFIRPLQYQHRCQQRQQRALRSFPTTQPNHIPSPDRLSANERSWCRNHLCRTSSCWRRGIAAEYVCYCKMEAVLYCMFVLVHVKLLPLEQSFVQGTGPLGHMGTKSPTASFAFLVDPLAIW
jgi:hypothetical protein